ncbi:MYCBP-associated protein [Electrophorus electricus]|uniref:MYCBP-associated protein n=1 Tax=Electrophorus electricus TaxID=8005 RepID=UPI0015D0456B|nr:MYCBP-associated protein [Electrophorus electricus]
MASVGKSTATAAKKEWSPRSPQDKKRGKASEEFSSGASEEQRGCPTLKGEDIQALAIKPEHLEKLQVPQPPKDSQKARPSTRVLVRKTRPPGWVRRCVRVAVARPLPQDTTPQLLDYSGPGGPRFDAQGMVLPHSILGSLEDFRKEMEARGEMELVDRIPDLKKQRPMQAGGWKSVERTKSHPGSGRDLQSHALQHWYYHMAERRRQQNFISHLLHKPVEELLMNQSSRFREIQEQRELISRGLPALHTGHGCRVGSEFWSIPQWFGDELSGIMATLPQTERGNPQPITHITQPHSTRMESGNLLSEDSGSRTWSHSQYLLHRQNELRSILRDLDFNQPEMDGLEIVGSSKPFSSLSEQRSLLLEEEEGERSEGQHKENEDPLALYDDVMLNVELLPALRVGGELALWTGSASSHQGEVGISVRLVFEAVVGESVCSHLELKNEGSTAIYYSWQRLNLPHSFTKARTHTHTQHYYFNTATAVILPGDTEQVLFTFKNACVGIVCEVWQLHTHPVLLGGASMLITLRGVALYQDKSTEQRAALELELEQREALSVCRSIVRDLLRGVSTPERPSSPAELYMTEEEHFHITNPNLHYHQESVEALKGLWEKAKRLEVTEPGEAGTENTVWDLSLGHLRQVVLSLPQEDPDRECCDVECVELSRDEALRQYNSLLLQLHTPLPPPTPVSQHCVGVQLWRELLDGMVSEALWLRHKLDLPETDNWTETQSHQDTWGNLQKEERLERKGAPPIKEEKKGGNDREKEEKKGAPKPGAKDKAAEKKVKEEKRVVKPGKEVSGELSTTTTIAMTTITNISSPETDPTQPLQQDRVEPQLQRKYTRMLHQQVYVLMERMIDSLCDLLDETQNSQEMQPIERVLCVSLNLLPV